MAASEGLRVDIGVGGRNASELPGSVYDYGLRGRILVQVGESCNTPIYVITLYTLEMVFVALLVLFVCCAYLWVRLAYRGGKIVKLHNVCRVYK